MAVYPANHRPFAIYSPEVEKTFFCFGGTDSDNLTLLHNVSYFDHKTKMLANPTVLLDKGTTDAHDNPVISIDEKGFFLQNKIERQKNFYRLQHTEKSIE